MGWRPDSPLQHLSPSSDLQYRTESNDVKAYGQRLTLNEKIVKLMEGRKE